MTGRNQGAPCSREPNVPEPMARLASLVTKAELVELLWAVMQVGSLTSTSTADGLRRLVVLINTKRRRADSMRRPLDASRLNGPGVSELREACFAARQLELSSEGAKP